MTGLLALAALAQPALLPSTAPKLVLLISIDQGRADYIDRFSDLYLPPKKGSTLGGFRWLSETGVRYTDAHHHHLPTATGPGHSILMTGSVPAINGIVSNDWFDRSTGKSRYVTDDDTVQTVGADDKSGQMSARPLKVTTVGDELKMATNDRSRVVGIAYKDRAAILMAGHAADEVLWYDYANGNFVTSTYYAKSLPTWVEELNRSRSVDSFLGKSWTPSLPESAYINARNAPHEAGSKMFSHPYGSELNAAYYSNVVRSGGGQRFFFDVVSKALDVEKLGQHDVPDVLVMNLSSNDYIGHAWGPNSPEAMDVWVETDRQLSRLFNKLNRTIPGGIDNVAIVVTADHGVAPIPADAQKDRIESGRLNGGDVVKAVETALDAKYGEAKWVLGGLYEQNLYLDRTVMAAKSLRPSEVEQAAAEAAMTVPGVYQAYTRTRILQGELPKASWSEWVTNGLNPLYGGDIMVLEAPNQVQTGATGTSHGSAWAYDTHVPILTHWRGQKPQKVARRVYTHDIASTISTLLGIEYPSGNVGTPLYEALPTK
jgi:predicted AlkP superfamily pyrophosphatase or phosphodiesterase